MVFRRKFVRVLAIVALFLVVIVVHGVAQEQQRQRAGRWRENCARINLEASDPFDETNQPTD